jgi:hypothetical protein
MLIINDLLHEQVVSLLEDVDYSTFTVSSRPGCTIGISFSNDTAETMAEELLKDHFGPNVILGYS